jgi:hypothetical protein
MAVETLRQNLHFKFVSQSPKPWQGLGLMTESMVGREGTAQFKFVSQRCEPHWHNRLIQLIPEVAIAFSLISVLGYGGRVHGEHQYKRLTQIIQEAVPVVGAISLPTFIP